MDMDERRRGAMAGETPEAAPASASASGTPGIRQPPFVFQFPSLNPQLAAAAAAAGTAPFWQRQMPMSHQGIMLPVQELAAGLGFPTTALGLQQMQVQYMAMQGQHGFQFGNLNLQRPAPDLNRPASPVQMGYMSPGQQPQQHMRFYPEHSDADHNPFIRGDAAEPAVLRHEVTQPQHQHQHQQHQQHQQQQHSPDNLPQKQQEQETEEQHEDEQELMYPLPVASHEDVVANAKLFLETLSTFHDSIGSQLIIPQIGGTEFEVHRLYCEVTKHGGLEKVIKEKKWKEIALAFNLPRSVTSPSYFLRRHYVNLLHHYEQVYFERKQGPLIPLPELLPMPLAVSQPSAEHRPDDSELIKKRGRGKFDQFQVNGADPAASLGHTVTGAIEGKFEHGYFVTVVVGSEKLRGVIYNVPPSQTETQQFADLPELMNSVGKPLDSPELGRSLRNNRRRRREMSKKDPDAPKPIRTGYNFFVAEQRRKLKGIPNEELSKIIGDHWNRLSEQEKWPYLEMGEKDKERYHREVLEKNQIRAGCPDGGAEVPENVGHEPGEDQEYDQHQGDGNDGRSRYHVHLGTEDSFSIPQQQFLQPGAFSHYVSTQQMGYGVDPGHYVPHEHEQYQQRERHYVQEQTNYSQEHNQYEHVQEVYGQEAYG